MKYVSTIFSIALAAFLLWLLNTKAVGKILTWLVAGVVVLAVFYCSWMIGEMLISKNKKEKVINSKIRVAYALIIGLFILYSIWKIIQMIGPPQVDE